MPPEDLQKQFYTPPQLEAHQWKFVTGGTTLPIGTNIFPDNPLEELGLEETQ